MNTWRRKTLFLIIIFFSACHYSEDKKHVDNFPSGQTKRISWIDKNNIANGPVFEYFENGKVKDIFFLKDDIIQGVYLEYNKSGNIVKYQSYSNNKRNGKNALFFENTKFLKEISNYTNDTLNGRYLSFYEINNSLKERYNYYKGNPVYEVFLYYPSGQLRQYQYRNNKGEIYYVKNYDNSGKPLNTLGHYLTQVYVNNVSELKLNSNLELDVFLANPPKEVNRIIISHLNGNILSEEINGIVKRHHMKYIFKLEKVGKLNFSVTLLSDHNKSLDKYSFTVEVK